MTTKQINIAIIGASGYTGAELIRLLLQHPYARIAAITGDSQAGKAMAEVYPHLAFAPLPPLVRLEEVDFTAIDTAFCCLPHGTTQSVVSSLPEHVKVIDLSADFRLHNLETYAQWYNHAHQAPELQKQAVYGLSEWMRDAISSARLVACPGCYPTSVQLPLIPLLQAGVIALSPIIIDAKSGITGAGRSAKQGNLFAEIDGGISAYSIGAHRHAPEIEQGLSQAADAPVTVSFTPHLMPMNRGILSTIYARLAPGRQLEEARAILEGAYKQEPFVHVLPAGKAPSTHSVRGTNHCAIGLFADRVEGGIILVSVIDNLVKGASGQAVQNFNLMHGLDEQAGLQSSAMFP